MQKETIDKKLRHRHFYRSAKQWCMKNLEYINEGSYTLCFKVDDKTVVKISRNKSSFDYPKIPSRYRHLKKYLLKHDSVVVKKHYAFAFQKMADEIDACRADNYHDVYDELKSSPIVSSQWKMSELDLCDHNSGFFGKKFKWFDY